MNKHKVKTINNKILVTGGPKEELLNSLKNNEIAVIQEKGGLTIQDRDKVYSGSSEEGEKIFYEAEDLYGCTVNITIETKSRITKEFELTKENFRVDRTPDPVCYFDIAANDLPDDDYFSISIGIFNKDGAVIHTNHLLGGFGVYSDNHCALIHAGNAFSLYIIIPVISTFPIGDY